MEASVIAVLSERSPITVAHPLSLIYQNNEPRLKCALQMINLWLSTLCERADSECLLSGVKRHCTGAASKI
jgi:hypothetical protein